MNDKEEAFYKEAEALQQYKALEAIEKNPDISQRELAGRLGIALGLTNSLLKTLVRKGLLKIRGKNNRSLSYHLTHAGVIKKSKLAMQWTLNTINFYREARKNAQVRLSALADQGIKSVVLCGTNELAEIIAIVASDTGILIKGIVGQDGSNSSFLGYPIINVRDLAVLTIDAVMFLEEDNKKLFELVKKEIQPQVKLINYFSV